MPQLQRRTVSRGERQLVVLAGCVGVLLVVSPLMERPLCSAFGRWAVSVIHAFFAAADLGVRAPSLHPPPTVALACLAPPVAHGFEKLVASLLLLPVALDCLAHMEHVALMEQCSPWSMGSEGRGARDFSLPEFTAFVNQ